MAKAKVVTKERKPKSTSFVRLRLTFEEAETLRFVCSCIGGTAKTPRRDMTKIAAALDRIDVGNLPYSVDRKRSSIYFLEEDGSSMADLWGFA